MSKTMRRRISALRRRRDFLAHRIAEAPRSMDLSYDRGELAGLRWAIETLVSLYPALAHPGDAVEQEELVK